RVETYLPCFVDGRLEMSLGVAQQLEAMGGIRKDEVSAQVQLEIDSSQSLDQAVMDLAGDTAALPGDGGAGLLFVQFGEFLKLLEVPLDLVVGAQARLDQLPHELGARPADGCYPHPHKFQQRALN